MRTRLTILTGDSAKPHSKGWCRKKNFFYQFYNSLHWWIHKLKKEILFPFISWVNLLMQHNNTLILACPLISLKKILHKERLFCAFWVCGRVGGYFIRCDLSMKFFCASALVFSTKLLEENYFILSKILFSWHLLIQNLNNQLIC